MDHDGSIENSSHGTDSLDAILGTSPAIETLKGHIRRFLRSQSAGRRPLPILIQGETGTGKGLLARVLHRVSSRRRGPFVDLNCAAVPETLVEAELFGFERGAFTDARQSKAGLVQLADGGTLFLDEIGLLSLAAQAKLLSALEDRAVRRLGSTRAQPVDVWIMAATNEVLTEAVQRGTFRQDLYYRLAKLCLELPSLRERGDDVRVLAEQFLARACADYSLPPKVLAPDALAALRAYPWPGNVRELGNVIERVAVLAETERLTAAQLGLPTVAAPATVGSVRTSDPGARGSFRATMREHLLTVLDQHDWNISRTATALGVSRNTIRARIARYQLRDPRTSHGPARDASVAPTPPAVEPLPARPVLTSQWQRRRLGLLMARLADPAGAETASRDVLASIADKVQSFGGRLDGVSPGSICGIFGLTLADEPAVLAAHCALVIRNTLRRVHPSSSQHGGVVMGVHSAELLVDAGRETPTLDADGARRAWGALDTLLAQAEPDAALVTAAAAGLLRRRFTLVPLDDGRPGSRIEGIWRAGPSRPRSSSDFAGRREELALLEGRLALAKHGIGQVIDVAGEPGIGKSRLLLELAGGKLAEGAVYLEGRCLPATVSTPYAPMLSIVRDLCAVTEVHSADAVRARVTAAAHQARIVDAELIERLIALLTAGTESDRALDPELLKKGTFAAIGQLLVGRSRGSSPLLIAVEDLHWIDPTSEACLTSLVEGLGGAFIVIVATYRLGYRPPWAGRSNVTQLMLPPLSPDDSRNVVQGILSSERLSVQTVEEILDRAEGNPLFLEELSRAALDRREERAADPVPDTIEEVITLRMGRLHPQLRQLLGTAAVVGREVPLALLRPICPLDEKALDESLEQLARGDFLNEAGAHLAEPGYSFKHALVHEVAYASLPVPERAGLHGRVVDTIEQLYPDRLPDHAERLAHHARLAGDRARAVKYLLQAGQKAWARSALAEATTHLSSGLDLLAGLPEDAERDRTEAAFQVALGIVLRARLGSGVAETERAFDRARALCERAGGDARQLVPILFGHWMGVLVTAKYAAARELGKTVLALAQGGADDHLSGIFGHCMVGMTAVHEGDVVTARTSFESALGLFRADEHYARAIRDFGSAPDTLCHAYLGRALWSLGYPDQALACNRQALARSWERDGALSVSTALAMVTSVHQLRRELPETRLTTERALAYSAERGVTWWRVRNTLLLAWTTAMSAEASEREAAVSAMRQSFEQYRRPGTRLGVSWFSALLAQAYGAAGQPLAGLQVLDEVLAIIAETGEGYHEAEILGLRGELLLMTGAAPEEAEASFRQGLDVARRQHAKGWELRIVISFARFLHGQSRDGEASALLAPIYAWFTEGFATPDLCDARALLAELGVNA